MKSKNIALLQFIGLLLLCGILTINITACRDRQAKEDVKLSADSEWHVRMADSEIQRRKDSLQYGKSNPGARWNYQTGLFLKSLLYIWKETGEQKYYNFSKKVIDSFLEEDGNVKTYNMSEYNIDHINAGKVLLAFYKETKNEKYRLAAGHLREQLENHPRTKSGGFWHKKRYPHQMWLDGIYMGSPFYAEYAVLFDQPENFDDVIRQVLLIDVKTRDPQTGLRYHGWDESFNQKWANPENGCSANFWGRGMGWYSMALVDILDYIPANHPKREQILFILDDLAKAVVKYQDSKSGLWYQVLDKGNKKGNYKEASASAMFVYFLAKAVNNRYLDSTYAQNARHGFDGIVNELIRVEDDGLISLTQICSVAGLGGKPYRDGSYAYYLSEPVVENDLKGVAPFIMASLQINKLKNESHL